MEKLNKENKVLLKIKIHFIRDKSRKLLSPNRIQDIAARSDEFLRDQGLLPKYDSKFIRNSLWIIITSNITLMTLMVK